MTGNPRDKRAWRRLSRRKLIANPLCADCEERGLIVPAVEVDHVLALARGGKLLDWNNLRSLCRSCHAFKTRTQDNPGQNGKGKRIKGADTWGLPLDRNSPFYKASST